MKSLRGRSINDGTQQEKINCICLHKNYQGEDLELASTNFHNDFTVLHKAGIFEPDMSLGMINCFLDAGSTRLSHHIDDFMHTLRNQKEMLRTKLP